MNDYYKAPWGATLIIMSTVVSAILIGMSLFTLLGLPSQNIETKLVMVSFPMILFIGSLLFTIRGFSFNSSTLFIQRLFWRTEIPLTGLQSVEVLPLAMQKSIRTMGNGGLFSFSGQFRNKDLGHYRAFATDGKRTVVLHFGDNKIVVTPDDPEKFAVELGALAH